MTAAAVVASCPKSQMKGPVQESIDYDFCAGDSEHAYWSEPVVAEQEPCRGAP